MSRRKFTVLNERYNNQKDELNPDQQEVLNADRSCVVLAGPGSGKTKVLVLKAAKILAEEVAAPRGVACITFSDECARELKKRLASVGVRPSSRVFIGTIHSFCLKQILYPFRKFINGLDLPRPEDWKIIDQKKQDEWLENENNKWGFYKSNQKVNSNELNKFRRAVLLKSDYSEKPGHVSTFAKNYVKWLRDNDYIDFEDMVLYGLKMLEEHAWVRNIIKAKFPVILVDEYQDLGELLHQIMKMFLEMGIRLIVAGDPDQSVYSFRGAKPELLKELCKHEKMISIPMSINYRCGRMIIEASKEVMPQSQHKACSKAEEGMVKVWDDHPDLTSQAERIVKEIIPGIESRGINRGKIAILYRDKYIGDVIKDAVVEKEWHYIRIDQNAPYKKSKFTRWLEDCASWCAGGWRPNKDVGVDGQNLTVLLKEWEEFIEKNKGMETSLYRSLIRFLWDHRDKGDLALRDWLGLMNEKIMTNEHGKSNLRDEYWNEWKELKEASWKNKDLRNYTVATFGRQIGHDEFLHLMTLHSSKGLQFDAVIIMGVDNGVIPYNVEKIMDDDDRRLLFVGMTRAIKELHITCSYESYEIPGNKKNNMTQGPSILIEPLRKRYSQ